MKRLMPALGLVLALASGCKSADENAIREAFATYMEAAQARNGELAATAVSREVFDAYDEFRLLALDGSAAEVRALGAIGKMMVLVLRQTIGAERLTEMDGRALFAYGVDQGMVGASFGRIELGTIEIRGDEALAAVVSNGREYPQTLVFHREGEAWRWDMTRAFPMADDAMTQLAREGGVSLDELIVMSVRIVSGRDVPDTIWDPPAAAADSAAVPEGSAAEQVDQLDVDGSGEGH